VGAAQTDWVTEPTRLTELSGAEHLEASTLNFEPQCPDSTCLKQHQVMYKGGVQFEFEQAINHFRLPETDHCPEPFSKDMP
jgi:hypothetical protein